MNNSEPNYKFTRRLVLVLFILILSIVVSSYILASPIGTISNSIITLILILVILSLSEIYDNFSIGKIFSLSKDNKNKDNTISELKNRNDLLNEQILRISTTMNSKQSTSNYFGYPQGNPNVKSTDNSSNLNEESNSGDDEFQEELNQDNNEVETCNITEHHHRHSILKYKNFGLNKFLELNNFNKYNLIQNAKIDTMNKSIDNISKSNVIYDGYMNVSETELFLQVLRSKSPQLMSTDSLYRELINIDLYNKISKKNAKIVLIVLENPKDQYNIRYSNMRLERIKNEFEPAVSKGLLRIEYYILTEQEQKIFERD